MHIRVFDQTCAAYETMILCVVFFCMFCVVMLGAGSCYPQRGEVKGFRISWLPWHVSKVVGQTLATSATKSFLGINTKDHENKEQFQ